jgi:DNA primase
MPSSSPRNRVASVARIKDNSVSEVKAAADIVEVVSVRTSLRRASSARFTGRCPFHEERTPSFSVDPVEKLYYCFGCGKGGDIVRFVQETENLDFAGAIEWLADRFRVTLEYEETSPRQDAARRRRDRLTTLLDQSTTYFERVLWESEAGAHVREYLAGRGLGEEVAKEFRLGLSQGAGLVAKARERGFALDEIQAAGLANRRGNDYFPFRLMFPLTDARGRVIGFQARRLREDDPLRGKYVNTPESELFKKGSVLYGLHLARPAIAKQDRAIVVEGNTDVIALRQAGVEPVVASMGTALTGHQVRELGRLTRRLFLCFDADAAGEEATLRGMELAVQQGFDVRVVTLPKGEDPADAPESFAARLGSAESYLHYRVRIALERAGDRQEAFVRAREILAPFEDSPERQEALRLVADRLDLPRETLAGLAPTRTRGTGNAAVPPATPRLLEAGLQRERDLLAAVVRNPSLLEELAALTPEHFDDPLHRRFREVLVSGAPQDDELVALRAELGARADRDELDERTGKELVLRLHERRLRRELQGAGADLVRATELQARLTKVHSALAELV